MPLDDDTPIEHIPDSPRAEESDGFQAFLVAKSIVEVREEPSGPLKRFKIDREQIGPARDRRKGEVESLLLVGFDTEYQPLKPFYSHNDVTKKRVAHYEVLSYQLFMKLGDHTHREIIVSDRGIRIPFVDFITYALAKLTSAGLRIPRTMVLVGHFNKADFPAFSDRDQTFEKLVVIRSSLITLGYPVKIRVMFSDNEEDFEEIKVHVRDSILMAPAGQKSLAAVGDLMGIPKIKLHEDPSIELDMKRNMASVRNNLWPLFREYALLDPEISALYFERMMNLSRSITGTDRIPTALSNIGPQLLVAEWEARDPPVERLAMIGKEAVREAVWNDATGSFFTKKTEEYLEELFYHIDFVTNCFHGGRGEQMWFGPSDEDKFSDYDLAAAYPTAMSMLAKPIWGSVRPTRDIEDLRLGRFSFAWVEFKFPDSVRWPTLPVRTDNGLIFPTEGRSYCCAPEIEVARNHGAEIKIKHAIVIDVADELPFFQFIKRSIELRKEAPTEIEKAFWKEVTNSCYGKTAQGLRRKRVFNLKSKSTKPVPESTITNPFFAAYITSLVRAVIGEVINAIPIDKTIFSVTTDGFLTNATDEEIATATTGPVAVAFSQTRQRLTGSADIVAKKHAVKQLLGIRTRGQATLQPGEGNESKAIVLAKAGIKTPPHTTTSVEQNDYIVEEFFNRQPGRRFPVDAPTSLREIMLFNADLVMKRIDRSISMEYDFKRRPDRAWDHTIRNRGKAYTHLAFTTKPWKTVEEFKDNRQIWKSFAYTKVVFKDDKGKRKTRWVQVRCLKTAADFRAFAYFRDTRVWLKGQDRAWLRSDLSRLRLNLCRAYQQGEAGLEGLKNRITARQFADLLNDCGFDGKNAVKTQHVEYGLRKAFQYHATPPTEPVLRVLRRLAKKIPSLRPGDIIPPLDDVTTLMSALGPQ